MKRFLIALVALSACANARAQPAQCPPAGYDRAALDALKANDFAITDDAARNAFARALTACVADPDPALRDGVAYEGLARFMRTRQLSNQTMLAIEADLEARLVAPEGAGFERPFAALVLSEVARADRVEAFLPAQTRARLLDASIVYFTTVRDYRGFDEREGWRHGVAHGADLLMQLSLNPAFERTDLVRIRDAVRTQIAPEGHFYIYGEPERLARPILAIARRGAFSEAEWSAWLVAIVSPAPLPDWGEAFGSQAGLARRHDVSAFVSAIYLSARLDEAGSIDALLPGAEAALRALP
jgi:hypothetical protein